MSVNILIKINSFLKFFFQNLQQSSYSFSIIILAIKEESGSRKRKFVEPDERKCDSDCAILWKINWPAMEVFLREDLVIDALSSNEVFDKTTLHVARVLVKVSETKQQYNISQSNPISVRLLKLIFNYHHGFRCKMSSDMQKTTIYHIRRI